MSHAVWTRLLAGSAMVVALGCATPSFALEDGKGSAWDAMMGIIGVNPDKDENTIVYRDRAPLVVPPKTELAQPLPPPAQRTADWPTDQELIRAKKKLEERTRRVREEPTAEELKNTGRLTPAEARARANAQSACDMDMSSRNACSTDVYWARLRNESLGDTGKRKGNLQAGIEPDREYLTQPPKGYMAPKKNVAAGFEPRKIEDEDVRTYFLQKPKTDE